MLFALPFGILSAMVRIAYAGWLMMQRARLFRAGNI